jgi:hypothetical protein
VLHTRGASGTTRPPSNTARAHASALLGLGGPLPRRRPGDGPVDRDHRALWATRGAAHRPRAGGRVRASFRAGRGSGGQRRTSRQAAGRGVVGREGLCCPRGHRPHPRRLAGDRPLRADPQGARADRPRAGGGPARRLLRASFARRPRGGPPSRRPRVPRLLLRRGHGGGSRRAGDRPCPAPSRAARSRPSPKRSRPTAGRPHDVARDPRGGDAADGPSPLRRPHQAQQRGRPGSWRVP